MQLMFRTRNGTRCLEWAHYALLRDNVEHYLESGPARSDFKALHGVERAEDGDVRYLRSLELRREIQRAWMALSRLKLADCAISLKTHALLSGSAPPFVHGTFHAKASGWELPIAGDESRPLAELLYDFVEALLYLTDGASPLDDLCVVGTRAEETGPPTTRRR
jgi:hypothetical protein